MEHPFTVALIGLGLIGGSMAKAITHFTSATVLGYDRDPQVLQQALENGAIQKIGTPEDLLSCDLILLALYPQDSVSFVQTHVDYIRKNTVVVDLCGVKTVVCRPLFPFAREHGWPAKKFPGFPILTNSSFPARACCSFRMTAPHLSCWSIWIAFSILWASGKWFIPRRKITIK